MRPGLSASRDRLSTLLSYLHYCNIIRILCDVTVYGVRICAIIRDIWLIWKDPEAGKDWRQEKGTTEDEMVEWHHRLNGHEFESTPGVGDGQGSLACCSPWGHKESDMTEQLNWTELIRNIWSLIQTLRTSWEVEGMGVSLVTHCKPPSIGPEFK